MSRQKPSLREPRPSEDLSRFPRFQLAPARAVFRLVRDAQGPWWFSSSLEGRFDLAAPDGTLYLASDYIGALLEYLGPELLPGGCAPVSLLAGRHLRELRLPSIASLADTVSERAARWVTAELSTMTPYRIPQAWARAFRNSGFGGIRYAVRHSTSPRRASYAIFGASGERRRWRCGRRIAVTAEQRRELRRRCGIELFEVPSEDALTFAP